jgi:hypothetical protein
MGGSGQPRPRPTQRSATTGETPDRTPSAARGDGPGTRVGQESGGGGRKDACPSNFAAEVTDVPPELHDVAGGVGINTELLIELREGDPAFLLGEQILGWLAVNIEEVTQCLEAGWRYRGIVRSNDPTPAGPVILTQVTGSPPTT